MKIGSKEHKNEYLDSLIKSCHENIWTLEVKKTIQEEDITDRMTRLKEATDKLDQKLFTSANEGKHQVTMIAEGIESAKAAIEATEEAINIEKHKIEQTKAYMKK